MPDDDQNNTTVPTTPVNDPNTSSIVGGSTTGVVNPPPEHDESSPEQSDPNSIPSGINTNQASDNQVHEPGFICEGTCGAHISKAQHDEGLTTCGTEGCSLKGHPFSPIAPQ